MGRHHWGVRWLEPYNGATITSVIFYNFQNLYRSNCIFYSIVDLHLSPEFEKGSHSFRLLHHVDAHYLPSSIFIERSCSAGNMVNNSDTLNIEIRK